MDFKIKTSYSLDMLNFINVLTGDEFYVNRHLDAYERFKDRISLSLKKSIKSISRIRNGTMLGPYLSLVISSVDGFEMLDIHKLAGDVDLLHESFSKSIYFRPKSWEKNKNIFNNLPPILKELEELGFKEYWHTERLPRIQEKAEIISEFASGVSIQNHMEAMLGENKTIDEVNLYLCSFASPHGIKICGPRYISDIAWSKETTMMIAVHEMFHPPYNLKDVRKEINTLKKDAFISDVFRNQNANCRYPTFEGFIEENVVEAMAISICYRTGLEKEPLKYFKTHDYGSHVLSVILFGHICNCPKQKGQKFADYFKEFIRSIPAGDFKKEYGRIIEADAYDLK